MDICFPLFDRFGVIAALNIVYLKQRDCGYDPAAKERLRHAAQGISKALGWLGRWDAILRSRLQSRRIDPELQHQPVPAGASQFAKTVRPCRLNHHPVYETFAAIRKR